MKAKLKKASKSLPPHGPVATMQTPNISGSTPISRMELVQVMATVEQLNAAGQIEKGIEIYKEWLRGNGSPFRYVALFNMAAALSGLGRREESEGAYREAIKLKPDFCEAHINLGLALEGMGKPAEAIEQWKCVSDDPNTLKTAPKEMQTTALNHTGRLLEILHDYEPAEEALRRSLLVNPKQPDAIQHWVHLRQKQCKWPAYADLPGVTKCDMLLATSPLAMLAESDEPSLQLLASNSFVQRKFNGPGGNLAGDRKYNHRRLRIGYLSSDFLTHAVGLLLPDIFEAHDRSQFETFGFCVSKEDGSVHRQRIISALEHFERVGHLTDEQIAKRIAECEIDILVDLNGLSSGTRVTVLSYRPAPVQATWLGFIGPTALNYVDYVIADRFAIPEELTTYYRERPLHLPHSFLPRDTKRELGDKPTRAQYNLPEDKFVFASFNNIYKINPTMFESWMRILQRVQNSVFWLLDDNKWATANLTEFAKSKGIDPSRLIFAGRVMPKDHLARLPLADLFLDNNPYNAGSTANDVLSVGLPLLTLSGKTFVSRMGGSLLTALGFPELITHTHEEYENRAVALGSNPDDIRAIRQRLAATMESSKATSAKTFTRNLEELLAQACSFTVAPPTPQVTTQPRPGQKSLLVRGWRDINHSFSLVNQFQLIEMLKRDDLCLIHEDMPYASPNWSASQNGSGFDAETTHNIASIPKHRGEEVDVALSISSPFSFYQGPAKKVVTFMVTEFGVDAASFVPGSPAPAAFTEGRNWVVTPSNWSKNKLVVAGMNPDRIVVVPHGVDTTIFRPLSTEERFLVRQQLNCQPGDFVFLNIGGAFWNKGGDLLLRAFAELKREYRNLKLVIKDNRTLYGRTTDEMVANLEKAQPGLFTPEIIQGIVILPTSMSMEQLRFLYGAADLYVSPYRAEGFNLPVLEAMACRTRVLVTGGGATDDFYQADICQKIASEMTDPEKSGVPTKGHYLEPNYEDLKSRMRTAIAFKDAPLGDKEPVLKAFLDQWSWAGATEQLLKVMGL